MTIKDKFLFVLAVVPVSGVIMIWIFMLYKAFVAQDLVTQLTVLAFACCLWACWGVSHLIQLHAKRNWDREQENE